MATSQIPVTELRIGDVIVNGSRKTPVRELERYRCSNYGFHVNQSDCYWWGAKVWVMR